MASRIRIPIWKIWLLSTLCVLLFEIGRNGHWGVFAAVAAMTAAAIGIPPLVTWWVHNSGYERLRRGECPRCGYVMGDSVRCPECGGPLPSPIARKQYVQQGMDRKARQAENGEVVDRGG